MLQFLPYYFNLLKGEGQKAATQQDALLSPPNVIAPAADNHLNPINSIHAGPSESRKVKRFAVNDQYLRPSAKDAERETRLWKLIPKGWKILA